MALAASGGVQAQEEFAEEVVISPLPSGHIQVQLQFTLSSPSRRHYSVLPKAIAQLAAGVPFEEVELSLTQGRWHHHAWGSPLLPSKPSGAELRAAFSPSIPEGQLPLLWGNLSHSLSGMFCASLNFLARPETTAQQAIEFGKPSETGGRASNSEVGADARACAAGPAAGAMGPRPARLRRLYAALPKEVVCTENLTPALKLLPCRDQAGVASLLLHRPSVYGADYHSMRVGILAARDADGALLSTRLSLGITLVLRPPQVQTPGAPPARRAAPRPCSYSSWRLGHLLGSKLRGACPIATQSWLFVQLPPQLAAQAAVGEDGAGQLLHPPAWQAGGAEVHRTGSGSSSDKSSDSSSSGEQAEDNIQQQQQAIAGAEALVEEARRQQPRPEGQGDGPAALDVGQAWRRFGAKGAVVAARPELAVSRYTTGAGFMHGGMVLRLATAAGAGPAAAPSGAGTGSSQAGGGGAADLSTAAAAAAGNRTVCVFQIVPWYVRVWLHTLTLTVDGAPADLDAALRLRHVSPAADRARPLVLDLCIELPAGAREAVLAVQFSKAFLHVFEWPPDAHRGFDVPAALVTYAPLGADGAAAALEWGWRRGGDVGGARGAPSPLLRALSAARPEALYSEGLLVPLAPPDFSMPYNVVCLTSTVLAVYVGAVLNALLKRPGAELREAAKGGAGRRAARLKAAKVVVVVVVFGGLALYVDEELQAQVMQALAAAGLVEAPPAPQH
ncbi:GPI transamidase component PIG-T [Monoraphidium neglectum]|uniref:GPI transamidase component PIG-T n=1 Tax=Monoraphidium neglectum TaxID=145388 RepID=A0A0D2M7I9_9CHLO|nr:GPI transamidase component PIG-T [Monoraphidium neglectum]KIY99334.1 GPI transamidase component PIG-T [Monoraphidium neglectum]|eukprot:XP_013898354.1 GPI transamidase component PIG-T [Monoraphidium neglectum]